MVTLARWVPLEPHRPQEPWLAGERTVGSEPTRNGAARGPHPECVPVKQCKETSRKPSPSPLVPQQAKSGQDSQGNAQGFRPVPQW